MEKRVVVIHRLHQILEPFMLRRQVLGRAVCTLCARCAHAVPALPVMGCADVCRAAPKSMCC